MAKQVSATTSLGQALGLAYRRWTLDSVVSLAHAVAWDFSNRPELYQNVGQCEDSQPARLARVADDDDPAVRLTLLQSLYGFHPLFPDAEIRRALMAPIFGASDGHNSGKDGSGFQNARMPLLEAAAGFATESKATSDPFHRERVRSAVVPLRTLLADLEGASLRQTNLRMGAIFDLARSVLRDRGVAVVFGVDGDIDSAWPLASVDPQGAKLVERISSQLADLPFGPISREQFVRTQRIAEKGAEAMRIILDEAIETDDAKVDQLIAQLFAWGSDLGLVGGARTQQVARLASRQAGSGTAPAA